MNGLMTEKDSTDLILTVNHATCYSRIDYPGLRSVIVMARQCRKGRVCGPDGRKLSLHDVLLAESIAIVDARDGDKSMELSACRDIVEGDYENIFIATAALDDFFENTHIVTFENYVALLSRIGTLQVTSFTDFDGTVHDAVTNQHTFLIHRPDHNRSVVLHVKDVFDNAGATLYSGSMVTDGDDLVVLEFTSEAMREQSLRFAKSSRRADLVRLGTNLLCYADCFPDLLVDRVPSVDMRFATAKHGSRTVTAGHSIDYALARHALVSPHFRRGHFRVLSSELFTKKRGQTIYVKPCFVRGHASTIEENALALTPDEM